MKQKCVPDSSRDIGKTWFRTKADDYISYMPYEQLDYPDAGKNHHLLYWTGGKNLFAIIFHWKWLEIFNSDIEPELTNPMPMKWCWKCWIGYSVRRVIVFGIFIHNLPYIPLVLAIFSIAFTTGCNFIWVWEMYAWVSV